jgi:hypothetical protein
MELSNHVCDNAYFACDKVLCFIYMLLLCCKRFNWIFTRQLAVFVSSPMSERELVCYNATESYPLAAVLFQTIYFISSRSSKYCSIEALNPQLNRLFQCFTHISFSCPHVTGDCISESLFGLITNYNTHLIHILKKDVKDIRC